MSQCTTRSCDTCGGDISIREDWSNPPKICKSCKEKRSTQWYERKCAACGTPMRIHRDWFHPAKVCKSCEEILKAKWYEVTCRCCGCTITAHKDWPYPPKVCKSCKENLHDKWYTVICRGCGGTIKANREWDYTPILCNHCSDPIAPQSLSCGHCGSSFIIDANTQIKYRLNNWVFPKKCKDCRELFKHKPFKTVKEETIAGNTVHRVYRIYNSLGQLVSEVHEEAMLSDVPVTSNDHLGSAPPRLASPGQIPRSLLR